MLHLLIYHCRTVRTVGSSSTWTIGARIHDWISAATQNLSTIFQSTRCFHFPHSYIQIDKMAGQAGEVRQIQAFEDASDNHPITLPVAQDPTVARFPAFEAASSLTGVARSLQQPSEGTNP
jgi:hypothetical protein